MNSNTAIKAINISKQYRLGEVGTGTLTHDLNRAWARLRGKEDPFLKIGESNDRSTKGESDYVWSLKDINFEIEKGDAVGIIGRNGAGKSTLLKLLSRVTKPTTGHFDVQGRIASLLEVGTGFNPEMTGRENIFLNGAILGMRRQEIKRKFHEIVDFAGVERYIDTPVKRYSSGMYVRLAFAVAAHLESEILIVDEVLAVGDAEFQKKCLGKMGDVSKGEGRTVLFVSHNMAAVQNLCEKGIFLQNGRCGFIGNISSTIDHYLLDGVNTNVEKDLVKKYSSPYISKIQSVSLHDTETGIEKSTFKMGENIEIHISLDLPDDLPNLSVNVRLNDIYGTGIAAWRTSEMGIVIPAKRRHHLRLIIKQLNVFNGFYTLSFSLNSKNETIDLINDVLNVEILPSAIQLFNGVSIAKSHNLIYTPADWIIEC